MTTADVSKEVDSFLNSLDTGFVDPDFECELEEARNKKRNETKGRKEYVFAPMTAGELEVAEFPREWLVKNMMVINQPCVWGGGKKLLKTSTACDLNISLGSGTHFLDKFEIPVVRKSVLISGESGGATIKETAIRVAKHKGIRLKDTQCGFDFRLPQLSRVNELTTLANGVKNLGYKVVIIDPLYLCLLSGQDGKSASNLFDMGPLLLEVSHAILEAGATPILLAHTKKYPPVGSAIELEDLAYAGISEFARQWVLFSRRMKYEGGGAHRLIMNYGGSAGHGGVVAVDINEGTIDSDFEGRFWDVKVSTLEEIKEEDNCRRETVKNGKVIKLDDEDAEKLILIIKTAEANLSRTKLQDLSKWGRDKFNRILGILETNKSVVVEDGDIEAGNGAKRKAKVVRLLQGGEHAV